MRVVSILSFTLILSALTAPSSAQGTNDADRIIMRMRPVCNYGQGSTVLAAFDVKARAGGAQQRIGGFTILMTYTSSKLTFQGVAQRYQSQYWGQTYRSYTFGPSIWYNQHATSSTGNALPLLPFSQANCGGNPCFEPSTDCSNNPLNDGYYEILRYQFQVLPSANGGVNIAFYNPLPFRAGVQYQQGLEATAIYYSDLLNNGNDSILVIQNMIIPVELAAFTATARIDGTVLLSWRTDTETSNFGFEVERGDGVTFERIGFVKGQGTTSKLTEYEFVDAKPVSSRADNVIFYRLKQMDVDGTTEYSPLASAQLVPSTIGIGQNYPNPAAVNEPTVVPFDLAVPATVTMSIYNSLGQKVATLVDGEQRNAGRYQVTWDGRADNGALASAGVYFIRFIAGLEGGESVSAVRQISLVR